MSQVKGSETVEQLKEAFDSLTGCCLDKQDGFDPVRVVAQGGDDSEYNYGPEGAGLAIFENADGRFGILEDWEDSTGHG